ncbi:RtxA repeat/Peptidase C80 family [Photorhabdus khanii NC19]|uniref:RtxA repeat/Peptidase C80 family n=1 Tax=Photorhabdus khanii NC19 TaxID=1004151 RepID=W3V298_9GAMM|nr:MARTX multifunctional-autoprocessing repeats-in-toxin holotoxin RtxA [Photorhabdus khanii]ETS29260.1 RtxA repeat/Peptidase C80 family [Photorhabdus khanii NC19]
MGKSSNRSTEYFFTGKYYDDNDGNDITAIGVGGEVYAYGGNDDVTVGSFKVDVYHTDGDLSVKGASGYTGISKTGNGGLSFAGAAGAAFINHTGDTGNLNYSGAAGYNKLVRKGLSGDTNFKGAGGYNKLWHETNRGDLYFAGAGAVNHIDRTWFDRYQGSRGNVTFNGAGAANSISSRVESGNITFNGAGADNHIVLKGKEGNIILRGAGASNRIERIRQNRDGYEQTRGDITFEGVGGYNKLYSDVAHGNINLSGAGAYNEITRVGTNSDFYGETLEFAKSEEIVLTTATMGGSWIQESRQVTGIKSTIEPDTYLFAFADKMYTKISKVRLQNNPTTGRLGYHATSWYKAGNHLENLAAKDISSGNGFTAVNTNGAYRLSSLLFEHQQPVKIHAVEENLLIDQWVTYAGGIVVKVEDISLGDAKMGGYAISSDGSKVDVFAVKSNRRSNTYVYAKVMGPYTKVVEVQLKNDFDTGQLKYKATTWYKTGDHTGNLANEQFSYDNGYTSIGHGYTLSQLQYSANTVRRISHRLVHSEEYSQKDLVESFTSSGYINFNGAGGGNVIKSNVTQGNVNFKGAGVANVILHGSKFGDTNFDGAGAANVIVKSGEKGDLTFRGAGLANVLVHQGQSGKMEVYAGGAVNVLVRVGDGRYLAHLLAYGNISIHKGNGDSRVLMLGGYNTHTQIGDGSANWFGAGGFNVITQAGKGAISSVLLGGANVLTKLGTGDLVSGMFGGANIITHISDETETSNTTAIVLGGANILTKKGKGNAQAVMGGGANVLTHIGDGNTTGVMLGGANILTKVGHGDTTGIMFGMGNVLTHVGDGLTLGVMAAAGNIFTKVGDGTSIAAMIGAGNLFTHVGKGDAWALMGGAVNVFTKVGDGNGLALMVAAGNVFTHIGDGTSVALMLAKGNIATKVGNGMTLAAMIGKANIFTHVGDGNTFAAMIGGANVLTKVGNNLTAAVMVGKANIYSHVGNGTSIGLFAGELNVMTKVGEGKTLAAMFGKANIMTHVGNGLTGVLALGEANIVTKVGDDFMGVVAVAKANVITHIGNATTAGILFGKGNILTKEGDGTTVGLLISDVGNVMTHVGDGTTVGFAKGKANLITKIGDGTGVNAAWGEANILTQVGNGDRYNFAKGKANIITKVGDGQEVTVVQGDANMITHVGNGDDYTGAWGEANVITKIGDGRNVVLAKGKANIVTQVGKGESFNALWSEGNIVTKVGDGMQVTAAKGKANVTTTVGNGLSVTAAYGDANINTQVGDGVSVNVAWGKYNINTKVGNGLNVAAMKGQGNANIQVGHGLYVNASYARNNVAIKIGDGDFYSLAVASSNTESNKLDSFFNNIKQTVLGVGGSQAINYLVQGDEANTSGTHKGRGAINLVEVSAIDGFKMEEIDQVGSDLSNRLSSSVTAVEMPDIDSIESALAGSLNRKNRLVSERNENLIVNGDFEQGNQGWQSTHGVEAYNAASSYGLDNTGHGKRVSELDVNVNTTLSQELQNLSEGEVVSLNFDFAKRSGLSPEEGMAVLWNGESIFSTSGGEAAWQNKTLQLTAQEGTNRIEFKGTGRDDGLGYILDNVVAKSIGTLPTNSVTEHARQDQAAKNALSDKEKAEKDRRLLEEEKDKQLAAIEKSKSQLAATDQEALNQNGQAQSGAIKEEAQAVTEELNVIADRFKELKDETDDSRELDSHYLDYAGGISEDVQKQLDDIKPTLEKRLADIHWDTIGTQQKVKDAVVLSEAGVEKGKQNRDKAILDGVDAQLKADQRKEEALSQQQQAEKAKDNAKIAYQDAESRGKRDTVAAESKAAQAQADAKGAKLSDSRPDRIRASGSGLSGEKAYESTGAGETGSHIDPESMPEARNRYYQGLTEEELQALASAKQAVNRLQINAGRRAKNTGVSLTPQSVETQSDRIVVPPSHQTRELIRKAPIISGINLEGLGGSKKRAIDSSVLSRAQKIAHIYRWLDNGNVDTRDEYIPVPGFKRVSADISDKTRQRMVTFVEKYIRNANTNTKNKVSEKVPEDEAASLAKLFVDATLDYDWDKRVEFIAKLDRYGYSFEPVRDDKSIVSFWSGKSFRRHRDVLEAAQPDGKKIVYDVDVQGNAFAIQLNKQLMRWGIMYLADPENNEHKALRSAINAAAYSNTGFWSSIYAAGSRGDVYLISEGGLRLGNYFWNVELPVLRKLQREGLVGEIRLLDKPASEYAGRPIESIGRNLTKPGITVQTRFDALTIEEQKKRLAVNPGGYKADTVVELDIKLSAIDTMLNQALPFYGLRTERNLLVQKSDEGFEVRAWPGNGNEFKRIIVKNTTSNNLLKAVERFILANYDNYAQLPDELYFIEDRIISHHQGHTRILTEKVNGIWKPVPKLMSVSEFQAVASVAGKTRGDSYQKVIDALESYQNARQGRKDDELDVIGKLSDLRQQVEGYLLGHPDSGRVPAMKDLLSQIDTRFEESMVLAESTVRIPEQGDFSSLYDKLGSANLKDSKHFYVDENGDFVTRGKANTHINQKAENFDKAVEQVKAAVIKEYGQDVSDAVFSNLKASDLSNDGKGIDVSGLRKIHQAIEQHLSPISATLFVWKPSDHSQLGHVAMQIGQGRAHINADDAGAINEKNYVSWWPSLNHRTLEADVAFEEHDKFGLEDGDRKLQRFIEKLQFAQGVDITFKDVTEGFAMMALENPALLQSAGISEQIYQPFVEMWNDRQYEMADVGRLFAEELRYQADKNVQDPQLAEKRVANVIREFKDRELKNIRDFKISEADQGRVFRINLEGLDVAAMQAEWNKISSDPNEHYQLLTNNCSSIIARVLKAGGAEKLVGHKWLPKFGTWTPTELFNYAQVLQEAQLEVIAKKQSHSPVEELAALSGKNKALETVVMESDGTPLLNKLITKDGVRDPLLNSLQATSAAELVHKPVNLWQTVAVTPQTDGRETRFDGQIIFQMEDDPVATKAAANLAGKHPDSSVVVQLDSDGQYRVIYGDPAKLSGKLRWQLVGHGRSESEQNNTRLSGYRADELAIKLKQFTQNFSQAGKPDHISLVGCSLIEDDKRDGFARHFIIALKEQDIHTAVSARRSEVAVDVTGRKFTRNENNQWVNSLIDNKIVLNWNERGELETHSERVRRSIAESDINLSRVGIADVDTPAKGAIVDNADIFAAPEERKNKIEVDSNHISNNPLSYSGNIQVDVGKGEFTALNWGTSNIGIKVGTGGFKSLAFGDNNVMVHIGNGDSKHSVDIAGYQALEGAQMFIGNRNVSFNQGRSNDLIVMMDKSLPTPPLVNPFDGAARISGVLQDIAYSGEEQDWLAAQDQQWTIAGAKKFVRDMSGLDQTSSVDYKTLVELDSQYERSSRGLKSDTEAALNKKFNQWLSRHGNSADMGKMSRADKLRQANEKLAFNFAVGGKGADIQVTTGNWNFVFGDNIQSILDINLGSLFGLMTQQYSTTGLAQTPFTYNPQDLPRQLKNKLLGRLAGVGADTTLADIFGVDYTADGRIVSRTGEPVDGVAILKEMIEVIGKFSGEQLQAFTDPDKLLDSLKSHLNMGKDGIRSFAEGHGLKEKTVDESQEGQVSVANTENDQTGILATGNTKPERAFGFNSLNLPNVFATIFSKDKQEEMKSLVTNLKENLTADLLNMQEKTFDFLRNSGHLQGDGDIHISLGNYNFNWGGDGKDLGAYLGDNNNFWGGRGDDVYYSIGTSNIFTGGEGNDLGVLMGRENWMFGGDGDDTAVVAGRINHVFMGEGNDQTFVFGEGGFIDTGKGRDYVVISGNYNRVDTGEDQDYAVTIGNNNRVELGEGNDFARVFGNDNRIDGNSGNDSIKLMGYHTVINGGEGDDHLIAETISKFSQFDGGDGQDLLVLGGYQNEFKGGTGVDSFVVSGDVIDNRVNDINAEDMIVFNDIHWQNLWFQRSGYDLVLSVNRHTQDKTAQGIFESVGSVTLNNYFNGNRAKLVAQMSDKNASGEREFTALSDNAVDSLIQAMSSFTPTVGDNGFIENLDSKAKIAITTAWTDTTIGKAKFA